MSYMGEAEAGKRAEASSEGWVTRDHSLRVTQESRSQATYLQPASPGSRPALLVQVLSAAKAGGLYSPSSPGQEDFYAAPTSMCPIICL